MDSILPACEPEAGSQRPGAHRRAGGGDGESVRKALSVRVDSSFGEAYPEAGDRRSGQMNFVIMPADGSLSRDHRVGSMLHNDKALVRLALASAGGVGT